MSFRTFMEDCGYKVQTTFWEDFSIADAFGPSAIQNTYNLAFKSWMAALRETSPTCHVV